MKHFLIGFSILASFIFSEAQVSIQVSIPPIVPNSDITIQVKINKGAVANFAKYQIDVPPGVYISEGDNKTGSFSFENNRAKIIWVSIPTEPEFTITMQLNPGTATGMGTINQKFYYLDNGNRKEVEAMPITLNFSGGPAVTNADTQGVESNASNSPSSAPEQTVAVTTPTVTETATNTIGNAGVDMTTNLQVETSKSVTASKENSEESIKKLKAQFDAVNAPEATKIAANVATAVPVAVSGMSFKVQIGAYGENPGMGRYRSLKGVNIFKEDNFYKVTVGNFKTREDAVKKKEELLSMGFKGFVVTYQSGIRIK